MLLYNQCKKIERHFYNYHRIKAAVELKQEEIMKSSSGGGEQIGTPTNATGDPTSRKVEEMFDIHSVETTEGVFVKPVKWLTVIEETRKKFPGLEGDLIVKRYFEGKGIDHLCAAISISRKTYYNWREDILDYATMVAIQLGLITVFGGR